MAALEEVLASLEDPAYKPVPLAVLRQQAIEELAGRIHVAPDGSEWACIVDDEDVADD
ncbi:MAG: hypothetical protein AAGD35_05030 [Actinomycetota bacterium]